MTRLNKMKKRLTIEEPSRAPKKNVKSSTTQLKMASILKTLYLPAGIFIDENLRPYSRLYLIILYTAFVCNTTGAAITINDEDSYPLESSYFVFAAIIVMITLQIGRHHETFLRNLYEEVKHYQESEEEFLRLSDMEIRKRIKTVTITFFVLALSVFAIPLYAVLFTDAQTDDYMVLIYPMWYPWKRDTIMKYLYALFMQYASMLVAYYLLIFSVGSFVFAAMYIHIRFMMLAHKILLLREYLIDHQLARVLNDRELHLVLVNKFVMIIEEHQTLIRFTRKSMSCFITTATIVVTYAFVAAILLITLFFKTDVSMLMKAKLLSSSTVALLALMACCYCGQLILNVNELLKDTMYSVPWYRFPIKIRKFIVIFMIQCQNQFEMKCYGLFLLCVPCIGNAFKFCYTCIQFLLKCTG